MKKHILILASVMIGGIATAQNEDDALRYSYLTFGSTARVMGAGGAFGAVGADFSSLSLNPAGIGLFKSSEFSFSPSLYVGKTESSYNGTTRDDFRYNFNLGNLGLVLSFPSNNNDEPGWRNFQLGFGLNRTNNFNNRMLIQGDNPQSSIIDTWVNYANGNTYDNLNDFDTRLAWQTWLIDTLPGNPTQYQSMAPAGGVKQRMAVTSGGSMNEWALSFGGNYSDKFYIGGTLGFPFINYEEESSYAEEALLENIGENRFRHMSINKNLDAEGSGFNFKFGMIFKPVEWMRLGAALHTPTYFYNMKETYSTSVKSLLGNGQSFEATSPDGRFEYKLNTPMRMIGSLAFIIGQYGLVSADYELVDYSEARLRSDYAEDFFDANDAIRTKYDRTGNLRLGTEWRLDQFSFRGGYALYGSPFKSDFADAKRTSYTVGFGLRSTEYFLDFAYILTDSDEDYYLYDQDLASLNPVKNNTRSQNFLLTLGFKF